MDLGMLFRIGFGLAGTAVAGYFAGKGHAATFVVAYALGSMAEFVFSSRK